MVQKTNNVINYLETGDIFELAKIYRNLCAINRLKKILKLPNDKS